MVTTANGARIAALALGLSFTPLAFGQTPAPPSQAPAAGQNPYRLAATLPARIVSFAVTPESIRPGQPVTLRWAVENPRTTAIDQGLGVVTPVGSRRISPAVTTTYTLTVTGPNGTETRAVTVKVAGTVPAATARTDSTAAAKTAMPRMPDGKPDLSGVYSAFGPPPAAATAGRGAAAAAPPAPAAGPGRGAGPPAPPLKPGAEKFRVVRGPTDTGLTSNCMPLGVPGSFNVPYPFQMVQTPALLIIFYEYPNTFRIIPIDGRPHPDDPDPTWMGNSVGRWEGDTLVVDSIGFNEKTEVGGYRHTEALHVVERFRRVSVEAVQYDVTIEDPNVFAAPWVLPTRNFSLRPEVEKIDEFVCENNRDYRPLFAKP